MTNKTIDLQCIVGKPVLCEFTDEDIDVNVHAKGVGFLKSIEKTELGNLYFDDHQKTRHAAWDNCRIYQHPDYWIANPHGDLVLPDGLMVDFVRRGDDFQEIVPTAAFPSLEGFIAVRIIGTEEDWSY